MIVVVLLVILALALGGVGLIIDALQWLLGLGLLLLLLAVGAGLWLRGKARDTFGGGDR